MTCIFFVRGGCANPHSCVWGRRTDEGQQCKVSGKLERDVLTRGEGSAYLVEHVSEKRKAADRQKRQRKN